MNAWYFDKNGQAAFTVADGDRIVSRTGKNLGWIHRENQVFSLVGQPLGWLEKGVLRNRTGAIVAFARAAANYLPSIPGMGGEPGSPPASGRPAKPGFAGSISAPTQGGWSNQTIRDFFGTDV